MQGKSHAALGAAAGLAAAHATTAPIWAWPYMAALGFVGGLAPDLDTESSYLGRQLPGWWHDLTPGHRGITHSLLFVAISYALGIAVQYAGAGYGLWGPPSASLVPSGYLPLAFTAGVASHVLADGLTTDGVPLLYPWRRDFRLLGPLRFATGSAAERRTVIMLLALAASYVSYAAVFLVASPHVLLRPVRGLDPLPAVVFAGLMVIWCVVIGSYVQRKLPPPKRRRRRPRSRRRAAAR